MFLEKGIGSLIRKTFRLKLWIFILLNCRVAELPEKTLCCSTYLLLFLRRIISFLMLSFLWRS
jgi:hypothetical protein